MRRVEPPPVLLCLLFLLTLIPSYDCWLCPSSKTQPLPRRSFLRTRCGAGEAAKGSGGDGDETAFMASLKSRIEEVKDRDSRLPVIVLDTMLPRQCMRLQSGDKVFCELIRELRAVDVDGATFAMVGVFAPNRDAGDMRAVPMPNGVEVSIVGTPEMIQEAGGKKAVRAVLRAGRRLKIVGSIQVSAAGWTEARVEFVEGAEGVEGQSALEEEDREENGRAPMNYALAMSAAEQFTARDTGGGGEEAKSLVETWVELARQRERSPRQIDRLLEDLGCDLKLGRETSFDDMVCAAIPPATRPSDVAFWIGALINPLPGMGVALEIRPQLLNAASAKERVEVALDGIRTSIGHMSGEAPLW